MRMADSLVGELDHEAANTRRVLERVPETLAAWRPHPKSLTMGELALHVANLPNWTPLTLGQSEMDIEPPGGGGTIPKRVWESKAALLKAFDEAVAGARAAIAATSDDEMMKPWTLKKQGVVLLTLPKAAVLRSFVFNHTVHHRGQLTVYLRLNDIPLPAIYGNSADER